MKQIIALLITLLVIGAVTTSSQEIKIVRSDVDSLRGSFVTATYTFGLDIITSGVNKCNGVSFELHYNQTKYIKFSGWRALELGTDRNSVVIPQVNSPSDDGVLNIGILSGDPLNSAVYDNPEVIHLEFVVLQSAPNAEMINFTFRNAKAVVMNDTIGEIIDLTGEDYQYDIHSYVNVWPGDADNNGIVNTDDVAMVGYLLGLGTGTKSFRSFKRETSTTLWSAQKVLTWDSVGGTYADCDGNAEVTLIDALVISMNYGLSHLIAGKNNESIQGLTERIDIHDDEIPPGSIVIPIEVNIDRPLYGISFEIAKDIANDFEFIKLTQGELFDKKNSFLFYKSDDEDKKISIISGSKGQLTEKTGNQIVANLILKSNVNSENPSISISNCKGIGQNGMIINLIPSILTDICPNDEKVQGCTINSNIMWLNKCGQVNIYIYDYLGYLTKEYVLEGPCSIDLSALNCGFYLIQISHHDKIQNLRFIKN